MDWTKDEGDFFRRARRESEEEFGYHPAVDACRSECPPALRRIVYPLVLFRWVTYVVELPAKPEDFPDTEAPDYCNEFCGHGRLPLTAPPARMHWLLWPVVYWVRTAAALVRRRRVLRAP